MPRAINSTTISFGLIAIPTRIYSAYVAEKVSMHLINASTGNRLKQQMVDAVTGEPVDKDNTIKGYEYTRDKCVTFSSDELKSILNDKDNIINIIEFVPITDVDPFAIEKTYYLGPNKGGDKPFSLLSLAMEKQSCAAVCKWLHGGKDELVILVPYRGGIVLHQMFYANEIRSFDEVLETISTSDISTREKEIAIKLVKQLSVKKFDISKYKDEYFARVCEIVQTKIANTDFKNFPKTVAVDLFGALAASLKDYQKNKKLSSEGK